MKKRDSCAQAVSESNLNLLCGVGVESGGVGKSSVGMTYLTTDELASKIKYDSRTIRERLKDSVLLEGVHYIRPFGGRKILYIWEKIEADMGCMAPQTFAIPMANGGVCHG